MKHYKIILTLFFVNALLAQKSVIALDSIENLLNNDVKKELSAEIKDKNMIFLGESEHHIGSDFEAKTQFVKFLVLEYGFKHIAFEGDFFALSYTHDKNDLYSFWAKSKQCKELFTFLEEHHVTIWGFDNQFSSAFSFQNFSKKLFLYLDQNKIDYDLTFKNNVEVVCGEGPELQKKLTKKEVAVLVETIENLSTNYLIAENEMWFQFLQSFKSMILQYTTPKPEANAIRDDQMAKNLNFLVKSLKQEKIIVWAANAHISRLKQEFMKGKTMGSQFLQQNDRQTYHIAFAPITMPYRKSQFILSQAKQPNNLLNLLPDTNKNAIIISNLIAKETPSIRSKKFIGMFGMGNTAFNYFEHFDALVFIANGEKVSY